MAINKPIFGLRFGSNEDVQPTHEDLASFLGTAKGSDNPQTHRSDLAKYSGWLEGIHAFRSQRPRDVTQVNFREKIFYGVLEHSQFLNRALVVAVEQYKYHLHELQLLDFRKPSAFIRSAEEEIGSLDLKRRDNVQKLAKLQDMVSERRKMLDQRMQRREDLAREMTHIALYVRENMFAIEQLCKTALVVLADNKYGHQKELALIEDIKSYFKDQLRDALHHGQVTKEHVEQVKKGAELLLKETSIYLKEDSRGLAWMYNALYEHTRKIVRELSTHLADVRKSWANSFEDIELIAVRIENVLVSLVKDCNLDLKTATLRTETEHRSMLMEKRKEMLEYLFDLLRRERRSRSERRSRDDRRRFVDPDDTGPERRTKKDRRAGRDRRQSVDDLA